MCLIIACPPGKTPAMDDIIDATIENPDGSGWCMRVNGGMEMVRSAHGIDHVIGSFFQARERWPNTWAVWHSRLATQGQNVDENTHPFPVTGRPWMLVHNGIMPLSDGPRIGGAIGRSDSRIFAEDHVSEFTSFAEMREEQAVLEEWLGYNKVVILSERREKGGPCLILNAQKGLWDQGDGCWYSHGVDRTWCHICDKRTVRCTCPSQYGSYTTGWKSSGTTYSRSLAVGTWTEWEDERDAVLSELVKEDAEDLDDYKAWWAKQDAIGPGDVRHTDDIDCECLECEELRYWEEKERDDNEDITALLERSFATEAEEVDA